MENDTEGAANVSGHLSAKVEQHKSKVNAQRPLIEIDKEVRGHMFGSLTAKDEKPTSTVNVQTPLMEREKEVIPHTFGSLPAEDDTTKSRVNVSRPLTENDKEATAHMFGSVTTKEEKLKSTVNAQRSLTKNDKDVKAHMFGSVTTKEEKLKSTVNAQRSLTKNDKDVKAHRDGSVTTKEEKPKSTVNAQRSLTKNDKDVKAHRDGSVTTKEEKPKSTVNAQRSITKNDKDVKAHMYGSVTTKEEKLKSTVNAQRSITKNDKDVKAHRDGSVTTKEEKPKSTVNAQWSLTKNDKDVKAHRDGSVSTKEEKPKSTVNAQRSLTKNDKDVKAHMFGSVTTKEEKPKSTVNAQWSLTKNDKDVKAHRDGSVTTKEKKPKSTVNAQRSLTKNDKDVKAHRYGSVSTKDEKTKRTVNVRRPLTENAKDVKAHRDGSVSTKDEKTKRTVNVRRPLTENAKDVKAQMLGSLTVKDELPKNKDKVRRPLTKNDKEVSSQRLGSVTAKHENRRPVKENDKDVKAHMSWPVKAKQDKPISTVKARRPLTENKEVTTDMHRSVTTKEEKSRRTGKVRRPLTENDKAVKSSVHNYRPVTAKDQEAKNRANIRSPLTIKPDETKTDKKIRRPLVQMANGEKAHVREHDKESKSTAKIQQQFTRRDEENKKRTNIQRPLTAKDRQAKSTTKFRRPLSAQDRRTKHSHDQLSSKMEESISTDGILELLSVKEKELESTAYISQACWTKEKEESIEAEGKPFRSAKSSSNYNHTENDLSLTQSSKTEDKINKAFPTLITFPDRLEDGDMVETLKHLSKKEAVGGQCALWCEEISDKSYKENLYEGADFDLDNDENNMNIVSDCHKTSVNQAVLEQPLFEDNEEAETTTIIRPTVASDAKSDELNMQKSMSTEVREKNIYFRKDEKVKKQSSFIGSVTGAKCLDVTPITQEEKYDNFQTQMGITYNLKKENSHVATYTSTDECKIGEVAENKEQQIKKSISGIQNKSIFRKSRELNGCRPKQNMSFQGQEYVKNQLCQSQFQENVSVNPKGTRLSFMIDLIDEDPIVIVHELTKSPLVLADCIDCTLKDEHHMFVFLQILAKGFSSKSTSQLMIILFETLKERGFFDILVEYLTRMVIQIKTEQADNGTCEQVLKHILSILVEQMTRNPSSVVAFRKLHALMGQVIEELVEIGTVDDDVTEQFELFTEQKKVTEKERRQSSMAKQYEYRKPPDDFRDYSVAPTADEITGKAKPFLRQNTIDGGYEDLNDYLDVQFRLLREDFVGPLREGMTGYIDIMTSKKGYKNTSECLKNLDIKVYENVRVHSPIVTQHGLCYKMKLQMTTSLKRTQWKFSKRLIYGSMVCLTDRDFKDFFLATVVEREEKDIKRGYFTVHFEREDVSTKDLQSKVFRMAETSGYFEAYRHVLSSLQTLKNGDLPFEQYIVKCEKKMSYPAYLTPAVAYDLRPLVDQTVKIKAVRRFSISGLASTFNMQPNIEFPQRSNAAKGVRVTDSRNWPSKELLKMDESQYRAVQTALTSEFAIIQGPPGTGKTYIGLQIVKALLHNKSAWAGIGRCHRPMLIVCYTNHALDQFLEGIVKYFEGDVLRVGGRSNSTDLEKYNLKKYRHIRFKKGTTLARLQYEKRQARRHMETQSRCVQSLAKRIQVYQSEILTEDILSSEMDERLYENLTNGYRGKIKANISYIVTWLGIEHLKNECRREIRNMSNVKKGKHVQVKDEITHVLQERIIDTEENLHFSENENSILQNIRRTDVAFYLGDANKTHRKKGKELGREEARAKKFQNLLKYTIAGKIIDEDVMSQEEADNIKDIWRLNRKSRWRLYRLWIQNICAKLYEEIETKREYFEEAAQEYQDALMQVDKEIMKQVAVIGMTTSGAARYQSVLRDIGPRIIVVEEAAEVLEAHIITTLSKGCEHLILIGDHKQLRPNPTVYKLAVKYNLDISLFERMVKNEMQFNCLELQHRMRPEISSIMRHIYPDLKDHDHVKTYPNVKGISTNLFLINHAHLESSDGDIKSYSNTKEAEYAVALCRYLLLQGYERQDVTVLTTYTGQLMYMRNIMPKEEFDGVNVTVVDNYQGEENKIVILSLVRSNTINKIGFLKTENRICVALSRAKIGFFVLGNFDHLANHSVLWKEITTDMKSKKCFGNGLVLYCQNHPSDNAIVAKDHEDFKRAPEGGCMKKCNIRLECGHKCERYCHVLDKEHKTNKCQKPCTKIICELDHKCPDKCYIECQPCSVLRTKTIPACGHTQLVPCATKPEDFCCEESCEKKLQCGHLCKNICGKPHSSRCMEMIPFTWSCGHSLQIKCWEAKSKLCPIPCDTKLQCNHICSGTCGTCFMGRVHQPCRERCVVQHICGHRLLTDCQNNPICPKPCENTCRHRKCTKRCGEPCDPCKEPCPWKCPHKICRRRCDDPCDRHGCNFPCKKLLKCKHKCIGLCGEPCPNICRVCHLERFKEETFGDNESPDARYILLENCGHLVEYHTMDAYMTESDTSGKHHLKHCPKCKASIRNCQRYGNAIKLALKDIECAKRGIVGDVSMYHIIKRDVRRTLQNANDISDRGTETFSSENLRANILSGIEALEDKLDDLDLNGFLTERQLLTVRKQCEIANEIMSLAQNITDCQKGLKHMETKNVAVSFLNELLKVVLRPRDIFTKQENEDISQEIQRGKAFLTLTKIKKLLQYVVGAEETRTDVQKIESVLLDQTKFTPEKESEINKSFERLTDVMKTMRRQ